MKNKEIINYIKQSRKAGLSDNEIKSELQKSGWQEEQIDAGLKNASKSWKSVNWIRVIIIVVIICTLFGAASYAVAVLVVSRMWGPVSEMSVCVKTSEIKDAIEACKIKNGTYPVDYKIDTCIKEKFNNKVPVNKNIVYQQKNNGMGFEIKCNNSVTEFRFTDKETKLEEVGISAKKIQSALEECWLVNKKYPVDYSQDQCVSSKAKNEIYDEAFKTKKPYFMYQQVGSGIGYKLSYTVDYQKIITLINQH
ncbi:MAG: hypothetical protein AAB632_00585 [Patescibacteria group bacterium]